MNAHDLVRHVVVGTNPYWPLSAVNRVPYRLALAAIARRFRRIAPAHGLYLRNGLTRAGWVPGISDIDLTLVIDAPADPAREYALLRTIWREYVASKRRYPMLGELDVLTTSTVGPWTRLGMAGHEAKQWQPVFGARVEGLGFHAGATRLAFDACNHAVFFCLDILQQRLAGAGAPTYLARHEMRRIAAKVLAYTALARAESRPETPTAGTALRPAALAAAALHDLDATIKRLDLTKLWAEPPAGAGSVPGADATLAADERVRRHPDRPLPGSGIDAVVDVGRTRIVLLRDGLDPGAMAASFEQAAPLRAGGDAVVKVVTPAVLAHWLQCVDPYLHTTLLRQGCVVQGRSVRLPAAPHERAFAHHVLAQGRDVITIPRLRHLVAVSASAFIAGRQFELAVERALFLKTLQACGTVSPWHGELAAESGRRHGGVLARAGAIRARAADHAGGAGYEAFVLLRELADDAARGIERAGTGHRIFRA